LTASQPIGIRSRWAVKITLCALRITVRAQQQKSAKAINSGTKVKLQLDNHH
jgi:hypothetical protein